MEIFQISGFTSDRFKENKQSLGSVHSPSTHKQSEPVFPQTSSKKTEGGSRPSACTVVSHGAENPSSHVGSEESSFALTFDPHNLRRNEKERLRSNFRVLREKNPFYKTENEKYKYIFYPALKSAVSVVQSSMYAVSRAA